MEVNETLFIETPADVTASQHERDRQLALTAPVEHQPLTGEQHLAGNPSQPSDDAFLERIHPGVVEAEVEVRSPMPHVLQPALDLSEIFVSVPDDSKRGAFAALIPVEGTDRDIELPDATLVGNQGGSAAAAVRVEIHDQHRCGAGGQGRTCRQPQAIESAKSGAALASCVVQT